MSTGLLWLETRGLARSAERQNAKINRAFVHIQTLGVVPITNAIYSDVMITFDWQNTGNTPTRDAEIMTNFEVRDDDLPPNFSYPYAANAQKVFIGASAGIGSLPMRLQYVDYDRAKSRTKKLFVWGRIDYRDILNPTAPRHMRFCFRFDAEGDPRERQMFVGFPLWGSHNGSDEDG